MKRRQPNAAQVSRTLAQAGHTKATEYQPFAAREQEGFYVRHGGYADTAHVYVGTSRSYQRDQQHDADIEAYATTLAEAGYNVEVERGAKTGRPQSVRVWKWEDES